MKHLSAFILLGTCEALSAGAPAADEHDVLARTYADFDLWGGVEVRLGAADSDVTDVRAAATAVPSLEDLRPRVYNDGLLPALGCEPVELSLSLTDDPTSMRVSWVTMDREVVNPRVEVLGNPCPLAGQVCSFPADTTTYSVLQKWWPTFNGSIHTAVVPGLTTGARYSYRVGSDSVDLPVNGSAWSVPASFNAAPAVGTPTTVALVADQGTVMPLGFAVTEKLAAVQDELEVALVLHVGDLSYAGVDAAVPVLNISSDDEFEHIWDLWQLQNQPIASTRPYMVGIGNHEAWYNWTAVTSRFTMPAGPTGGAVPPFWWSMNHGLAHFAQLCSEFPLDADSPQGQWLAADLAAASSPENRTANPWLVVTVHRPPYSSDKSWEDIRLAIEPLLAQYQVDLVVSGHMHAYERTHPVTDDGATVVLPSSTDAHGHDVYEAPKVPVYITQGNSGAAQEERWQTPTPAWSAVRWANGKASNAPPALNHAPAAARGDSTADGTTGAAAASAVGHASEPAVSESSSTSGGSVWPYTYTDTFGFGVANFVNATAMRYESVPVTGNFTDQFWIVRPVPVV